MLITLSHKRLLSLVLTGFLISFATNARANQLAYVGIGGAVAAYFIKKLAEHNEKVRLQQLDEKTKQTELNYHGLVKGAGFNSEAARAIASTITREELHDLITKAQLLKQGARVTIGTNSTLKKLIEGNQSRLNDLATTLNTVSTKITRMESTLQQHGVQLARNASALSDIKTSLQPGSN